MNRSRWCKHCNKVTEVYTQLVVDKATAFFRYRCRICKNNLDLKEDASDIDSILLRQPSKTAWIKPAESDL
jgi:transcription elongation factor Elf1